MNPNLAARWRAEPMLMKDALWPHVVFSPKQIEVIESVRDNKVTLVPAGNMLGKDFMCGFIVCWFFAVHYSMDLSFSSVRIITTSVKEKHLDVLWAEISKFVYSARMPLIASEGGPWVVNDKMIRHKREANMKNAINYVQGLVASKQTLESMQGHHARNTLILFDEASGIDNDIYDMTVTWAKKVLAIGNPLPCNNFFREGVKEGDLLA